MNNPTFEQVLWEESVILSAIEFVRAYGLRSPVSTYPPDLIEPCILAGAPEGGIVLDPFSGAGTMGVVA